MKYIGLDVHKDNTVACAISAGGKAVMSADVRTNAAGLSEIHQRMNGTEYAVMMESSTYSYVVYRYFSKLGVETHVVHARSLKMITDTDKKTDILDAERIGRCLRLWKNGEIELSMSYLPSEVEAELKDLCRYKEELSNKLGDEVRRIRSHMHRNCLELPSEFQDLTARKSRDFLTASYGNDYTLMRRLNGYSALLDESKRVAREIERRGESDRNVALLESIPGIGRQTAVQLMSMIVDVSRFKDAERLCAYFGMVPRVRDSGGKEHHGRMTRNGDPMMRSIMERITLSHVRFCDSTITSYFKRKSKEMGIKKALMSAARKMLAVIHAVLTRGTPFTA
jgi:transposase